MAWLYKQPGSAKWWIGWRVNGKQFLKSTGEADKSQAEKKLHELEFIERAKRDVRLTEAFVESFTAKPQKTVSLKGALEDWLAECKGATSPATWTKYDGISRELISFFSATEKGPQLRDMTTEEIRSFLVNKRKTSAVSTVNLHRKILSSFFIRAIKNSVTRENPVLPIKPLKASRDEQGSRRPFTLAEVKLMFEKAPTLFWRYMITGEFYTGWRMGDLITMPKGALDLKENSIRIKTRKTGAIVTIPISKAFQKVINAVLAERPASKPHDPLWPEEAEKYEKQGAKWFSNQFRDEVLVPCGLAIARTHQKTKNGRANKRDLETVSFHSLRHTFVSMLKATGGTQAVAKALAGHTSDLISDHYTTLPFETLNDAISKLPEVGQ